MLDARKILADLQHQAERTARDIGESDALEKAKQAAIALRERIRTDRETQAIAAGAGGLLLLGLLGTKGGRRFTGDIAKTGAIAALGAVAYKTWMERQGRSIDKANLVRDAEAAGFPVDAASDPQFALAVVRTMLAAAYADGVIDKAEQRVIDAAAAKAELTEDERAMLAGDIPEEETLRHIEGAARSKHHAAELYAAAVIAAGELDGRESAFLKKLAARLGLTTEEADALRAGAQG